MVVGFLAQFAVGRTLQRLGSTLPWQIWAALGLALLCGTSAWIINDRAYNRGFADADAQWQVRVEEEVARQRDANEAAQRAALEQIERLNEARRVRDATIERLSREAREDPDADHPALGSDSVRRLNSVLE